jgi:hypothetical protein
VTEVSALRLYLLRAMYLLIAIGLGSTIWPLIVGHTKPFAHMQGVAIALLGALSVLAWLGVRYPLQMLPLLLFELSWKAIWLIAIALPLWWTNQLEGANSQTAFDCLVGVVLVPLVLPWRYVLENYGLKRGDRWRLRA